MSGLIAQVESLTACMDQWLVFAHAQHDNLAIGADGAPLALAFNPRADIYAAVDAQGLISFITLRDAGKGGEMVGYCLSLVQPHLHYGHTVMATTDRFEVTSKARDAGGVDVLYGAALEELRRVGVQRWLVGERLDKPAPIPFFDLGFLPVEAHHALWIGA